VCFIHSGCVRMPTSHVASSGLFLLLQAENLSYSKSEGESGLLGFIRTYAINRVAVSKYKYHSIGRGHESGAAKQLNEGDAPQLQLQAQARASKLSQGSGRYNRAMYMDAFASASTSTPWHCQLDQFGPPKSGSQTTTSHHIRNMALRSGTKLADINL
jgi:hypothetical protein